MLRTVPRFLSRCGVCTMHQHVELLRQRELRAVVLVLGRGLVVVADLADRHHAFLGEKRGSMSSTCSASASLLASLLLRPMVQ